MISKKVKGCVSYSHWGLFSGHTVRKDAYRNPIGPRLVERSKVQHVSGFWGTNFAYIHTDLMPKNGWRRTDRGWEKRYPFGLATITRGVSFLFEWDDPSLNEDQIIEYYTAPDGARHQVMFVYPFQGES